MCVCQDIRGTWQWVWRREQEMSLRLCERERDMGAFEQLFWIEWQGGTCVTCVLFMINTVVHAKRHTTIYRSCQEKMNNNIKIKHTYYKFLYKKKIMQVIKWKRTKIMTHMGTLVHILIKSTTCLVNYGMKETYYMGKFKMGK